MRFVFSAMRARVIHMSWPKAGTSGHQTARMPSSSARSAYSAVRGPGGRRKSLSQHQALQEKVSLRRASRYVGWSSFHCALNACPMPCRLPGQAIGKTHQHSAACHVGGRPGWYRTPGRLILLRRCSQSAASAATASNGSTGTHQVAVAIHVVDALYRRPIALTRRPSAAETPPARAYRHAPRRPW